MRGDEAMCVAMQAAECRFPVTEATVGRTSLMLSLAPLCSTKVGLVGVRLSQVYDDGHGLPLVTRSIV